MNAFALQVDLFCRRWKLLTPGNHVVAAFSGGPDSTALLHALLELSGPWNLMVTVAHFNHGLRNEADAEASSIGEYVRGLGLDFVTAKGDTAAASRKGKCSIQEAARELRYEFLGSVCRRLGAQRVAVGHTRDDQVEEILLRLCRGTGPDGLSGMPVMRAPFIRPLLGSSRPQILEYLNTEGVPFIEDPSNRNPRFLRNRIRWELLPVLEALSPGIRDHLTRVSELSRKDSEYLEDQVGREWRRILLCTAEGLIVLDRESFVRSPSSLASRAVRKAFGELTGEVRGLESTHVESLIGLAESQTANAHLDFPKGVFVEVSYDSITLGAEKPFSSPFQTVIKECGRHFVPEIQSDLVVEDHSFSLAEAAFPTSTVSAEALRFPLVLRSFRPGDRLKPPGMTGTKKVKNLFMDRKIPRWLRSAIPLVICGDRIVCIPGIAVDRDFARPGEEAPGVRFSLSGRLPQFFKCAKVY